MELQYKEQMAQTAERWEAFWAGEVLDRPLVCVTAPKRGHEKTRRWHGIDYRRVVEAKTEADFQSMMEDFERFAGETAYLGESIPFLSLDYGPDNYASYFGAELFCSDTVNTTWVNPIVGEGEWDQFEGKMIKGPGSNYERYMRLLEYAGKYSEGKFLLSVPDTHSNMDAMSALRGPENLCYDLMDYPDEVEEALKRLRATYKPYLDEVYEKANMKNRGSLGWIPTYTKGRFATVQCDFSCLMSPDQGKRYVIPSIEEEVSYLNHASYHYDGKEALVHLDNVLGIKGIDVIQWGPGDGQPRTLEWMDLLHKIQAAGKGLWLYDWTAEEIKLHFKELKPEKLVFSVDVASEDEAEDLLEYLKTHM